MARNRKIICYCFLFAVLPFVIGGCATVFKGTSRDLQINSDPPGAEVYIDGSLEGSTPTTVSVKSTMNHRVSLKMDGYEPLDTVVFKQISPVWVSVDLMLLWLPAIVDMATGAWYELNPAMIYAVLKLEQ
jgi:hypothetical protein